VFITNCTIAQEKIKLRIGFNTVRYSACRNQDGAGTTNTTPYYQFKTYGYTPFDKYPLQGYHNILDYLLGESASLHFSLEKKLRNNNMVQIGILLRDNLTVNYSMSILGAAYSSTPSSTTSVFANNSSGGYSINARRYFIALERPVSAIIRISPEREEAKKKRTHITTSFRVALNVIEKVPTSLNTYISFGNPVTYTGDTLIIDERVMYSKQEGFRRAGATLQCGLSFKLETKKEKELFCINLSYEQGFFTLMGKEVTVSVKNYVFYNAVLSRGSRLTLSLTKAFNLPNFKKKKEKEKLEKTP
jgi:hypothetical protein